jgi:hypothetical protein
LYRGRSNMALSQFRADVAKIRAVVERHRVADQAAAFERELAKLEGPARESALELIARALDLHQAFSLAAQHEVVVLVHGIRTEAPWEEMVRDILEDSPRRVVVPLRYGRFDALRFWFPLWTRTREIRRILLRLQAIHHKHADKKLSIVAHSFGTYAIGRILRDTPNLVLHRLVLCGSILPRDFRWDHVSNRLQSDVMNECGTKDVWPVIAGRYTWRCGASGTYGFGTGGVYDRFHAGGHSDYFSPAFVTNYWLPLFDAGDIVHPPNEARRSTPWWLRFVGGCFVRLLVIALLVYVIATAIRWLTK